MVSAADVKRTFFDSVKEGWSASTLEEGENTGLIAIPELAILGYKTIRYGWRRGPWLLLDTWLEIPNSPASMGFTVIGHGESDYHKPAIWYMQYGGWYHEDVIPFLKKALAANYNRRIFLGGRGPKEYKQGNLVYRNRPTKNDFDDFQGEEEIRENGTLAGFHWYRGMLLLPQ